MAAVTAFDPNASHRWLFCFTHPDDEISIAAWIARLTQFGAKVWVGWSVTDDVRAAEGRRVMSRLGVAPDRLFRFNMPDGECCDHLGELTSAWTYALDAANPTRIAVGAFECGHLDHDSTNFAVHNANGAGVPIFEIPFYHTYLSRIPVINRFADGGGEVIDLNHGERKLKKEVAGSYPGQNIASLLRWYTAYRAVTLRPAILCATERMRLQTHFDYLEPNLPPALAARVKRSAKWARWVSGVNASNCRPR